VPMNSIRRAMLEHRPSVGIWSVLPGSVVCEALGSVGFDWILIDTEHGGSNVSELIPSLQALQLSGTDAIVRVPWNDPATIMRVLDLGAAGVIVPMVSSAEEAKLVAQASRYPPMGIRSWGPTRGGGRSTREVNEDVIVLVMVETAEGLANVDEIVATEGIDGVFIGPVDLGLSLGCDVTYGTQDPRVRSAIDVVIESCIRHSRIAGTVAFDAEHARDLVNRGISFLTLGADAGYLRSGAMKDLEVARSLEDQ
jgi:4-hydroxy-2-oxoheptanedioate aldolase